MAKKNCTKCKEGKSLDNFRQYKSIKGKYYFSSYCNACHTKYINNYNKSNPWIVHYRSAYTRTHYPNNGEHHTYKKRIFNMTVDDFKTLWSRDKAWLLKQPTVDRINNDGHYELNNCRFIEKLENIKKGIK